LPEVVIDYDACDGVSACGECIEACPMNVLDEEDDKPVVANPDDCTGCGLCEQACPNGAIEVRM
jgi:NAD-dependent dihydropyrimidine dehydrogenase PreA subunit